MSIRNKWVSSLLGPMALLTAVLAIAFVASLGHRPNRPAPKAKSQPVAETTEQRLNKIGLTTKGGYKFGFHQ